MKVKVLDKKGTKIEDITLSDEIFNIKPNESVLRQYIRVYRTNQRQGTSSTKTRSEVSGGGKKPWRQKGTGRARHGSIRSPIWVGGGVAHGPKPRPFSLKMPKKMKVLAFKSALSIKFNDKKAFVVDKLDFKEPKTNEMVKILEKLKIDGKSILIWLKKDINLVKSASNIPFLKTRFVKSLNPYDLIENENIIFIKDAVLDLDSRYKGSASVATPVLPEGRSAKDTASEGK